jgi:phosphoserine/homoserine phosphotransferase
MGAPWMTCLDLEGVLVPEIWIGVAERTGIDELRLTTRDLSDYDELMTHRFRVLDEHGIGLGEIQEVIAGIDPLPGAREFLDRLRATREVIILSDTFYEFARPIMRRLGWPTIFCHNLVADGDRLVAYKLRLPNQKQECVAAFQKLGFRVAAAGDSYNDTAMLGQADIGALFNPPPSVQEQFPQFPVAWDYEALEQYVG